MISDVGNLVLIFVCLLAGIFAKLLKLFPQNSSKSFNRFVIYFSLPALIIKELTKFDYRLLSWELVMMPWVLFLLSAILWSFFGKILSWPRSIIGALILMSGLGNTSFVGFPLLEALKGSAIIGPAIVLDQFGTFLCAGTMGVVVAQIYGGQRTPKRKIFANILRFPPLLSVMAAFLLRSYEMPLWILGPIDKLAGTLVPLALFSVGLQLNFQQEMFRKNAPWITLGLGFKMFIAPLFFLGAMLLLGHQSHEAWQMIVLESAMAPMITAGVIANEHKLDEDLVSLMLGIGIPISFMSVPLWDLALRYF